MVFETGPGVAPGFLDGPSVSSAGPSARAPPAEVAGLEGRSVAVAVAVAVAGVSSGWAVVAGDGSGVFVARVAGSGVLVARDCVGGGAAVG